MTLSLWFLPLRVVARRWEVWGRPCPAAAGPVGILTVLAPRSALRPAGHVLGMYALWLRPSSGERGGESASWWGRLVMGAAAVNESLEEAARTHDWCAVNCPGGSECGGHGPRGGLGPAVPGGVRSSRLGGGLWLVHRSRPHGQWGPQTDPSARRWSPGCCVLAPLRPRPAPRTPGQAPAGQACRRADSLDA